jgi:hypothetical protein
MSCPVGLPHELARAARLVDPDGEWSGVDDDAAEVDVGAGDEDVVLVERRGAGRRGQRGCGEADRSG